MDSKVIEQKVLAILPDAEMEVEGEECSFSLTIVSDGFAGLNTVRRQQMVLSGFTDELASGALHALTVKAYTLEEWNNKSSGLVQLSL